MLKLKARRPFNSCAALMFALPLLLVITACNPKYGPREWGAFNALTTKAPRPQVPVYKQRPIPYDEYLKWVYWGEQWFRGETFGNERVWTDVVGLLNATIDLPAGENQWQSESVFKYFVQSLDALDGVAGNLYRGNGGGYTHDLVLAFPPGARLDKTFPLPEKLHTGLDVEAGAAWPLGIVPFAVSEEEARLPYLLDAKKYASGPEGVGEVPGAGKFRAGLTCALCHYSLDIDWDGKTDLRSAKPNEPTPGSAYQPQHAWAVGNQDLALGWIFALSSNTIAGFENSAPPGKVEPAEARAWAKWVLDNYEKNPEAVQREVNRGLLLFPRGYADDTPDGLHNPLQFPSLFTHMNWPFNYDGVMLNASDRNNNVWTAGVDPTELVALCRNRSGKAAKFVFWAEKGMYHEITAEQYADIFVAYAPAAQHDPTQREKLRHDILGLSDGVPGLLRNDGVALISGVPGALPKEVRRHPDNEKFGRVRAPKEFGSDGKKRGPLVGLLGTRVITTDAVRAQYGVEELEKKYGLNGDEFVTEAVSLMLDWVEPPPNLSPLLANARTAGLVEKGYEIFKTQGCAKCHAGPIFTNNLIVPLKKIGTNSARAEATAPVQTFLAPKYDPATGRAVSGGFFGFFAKLFGKNKQKPGYKVVTLRYLYGSAPYLHDGGVGVALRNDTQPGGDDLQALLARPAGDKIYGMGQILNARDAQPASYLRPHAALSLQAMLLQAEREKVIAANREAVLAVPGEARRIAMKDMQIEGVGHEFWIQDQPGGEIIAPLIAFLLALDDEPGK